MVFFRDELTRDSTPSLLCFSFLFMIYSVDPAILALKDTTENGPTDCTFFPSTTSPPLFTRPSLRRFPKPTKL